MNAIKIFMLILFHMKYISMKIDSRSKCGSKLLDDLNVIPDSAFSASSFFIPASKVERQMDFSPKAARECYDKDNQEFAWCPKHKVYTLLNDYLEIDLGRLTVINFAQTRGRFAQGAGKEYSPFYKIRYRREDTDNWRHYRKIDKTMGLKDVLKGPSDPFLDAYETLDPPIVTRWIRIYPYSYDRMRVCLKLQLFGCIFDDHVIEYRIHQGSVPKYSIVKLPGILPAVVNIFQDSSFDGQSDQGLLINGLGRLTDNKTGGQFLYDPAEAQHYVGWNRKEIGASDDQSVTLWFRFDSVRNFSSVKLYIFENQTLQIMQPEKMEAKFSLYGDKFSQKNTIIANLPETKSEQFSDSKSPWIQFNMHQQIGQYLQLKLYFQTEWIILSEIDFISEYAAGYDTKKEDSSIITTPSMKKDSSVIPDNSQSQIDPSISIDVVYMLTILLCLLLGIILAITIFWLVMRHRRIKRKKDMKKHELAFYSQNPFKTLNMSPHNQGGFHLISNSYLSEYQSGLAQRGSLSNKPEPCIFTPNLNNQNCMTISKPVGQINDSSIYTSIPGSDNDSSIGTDYMANSGVNSSHTYNQTVPLSESVTDFMINQPQIIGNPLVELLDKQQYYGQSSNSGIYSYEPDLVAMTNSPNHSNLMNNNSQFYTGGSSTYQPIDYNNSIVKSFFSIPNKYRSSPMKLDPLLR